LKLGSKDHPQLVRNEHLFMLAAKQCGIKAAATSIVVDKNGEEGLLVERFDRTYQRESKRFLRHHLEDACQFLGRYPQDKYRLSLRQIADGISALATGPQIEILRLIELYLFSYLIGNGDLHGKNISLLEDSGGRIRLAPGYDLLSTLPYGDRSMALQLNGKDQSFSATDVLQFGAIFGIPERALRASLNRITSKLAAQIPRFQEIGLPQKKRADLERTCLERINGLLG
jgi:serine/threonine-protein kinase HipA